MKRGVQYGLASVVVAALVVAFLWSPVNRWLLQLVQWASGAGAVGVGIYAVAYVLATVLFLPGSILTVGAGFVYGPLWGTLLVSPTSVLGASLAFAIGRSVAREWVARRIATEPGFRAIDEAIGEAGFKIVFLLRLSPIFPFNLLNYALGLTRVRFRDYVLASFLGMLPGTFLYVYAGSLVTTATELLSSGRPPALWSHILYWGGLAATIAVTAFLTRIARRTLDETLELSKGTRRPHAKEMAR